MLNCVRKFPSSVRGSFYLVVTTLLLTACLEHGQNSSDLVSITVTPDASVVTLGDTKQLTATGNYIDGSTLDITPQVVWLVQNGSGAATINRDGVFSPTALGSVTVTASAVAVRVVGTASVTIVLPPPAATGVSPDIGNLAGGDVLTITGTGFYSGITVNVGGHVCAYVKIVSPSELTCVTSAHAAGLTDIVLRVDGFADLRLADSFYYRYTKVSPRGDPRWSESTIVATNSKVIIFGGSNGEVVTNHGSSYDPTTDTWQPIADAPSPRWGHGAVWTGTVMLVWGGSNGTAALPTEILSYDPVRNSWTTLTPPSPPQGRVGHVVSWDGANMVIWGGLTNKEVSDGATYNPASNTWKPTAPSPLGARLNIAAFSAGKEVYIFGGNNQTKGVNFLDMAAYDSATDRWRTLPNVPSTCSWPAVAWGTSQLIAFCSSDQYLFDPQTTVWTPLGMIDFTSPLNDLITFVSGKVFSLHYLRMYVVPGL